MKNVERMAADAELIAIWSAQATDERTPVQAWSAFVEAADEARKAHRQRAARQEGVHVTAVHLGYVRVSTAAQHLEQQEEALRAAGVERIFKDKSSGARRPDRRGLLALLDHGPAGKGWHRPTGARQCQKRRSEARL